MTTENTPAETAAEDIKQPLQIIAPSGADTPEEVSKDEQKSEQDSPEDKGPDLAENEEFFSECRDLAVAAGIDIEDIQKVLEETGTISADAKATIGKAIQEKYPNLPKAGLELYFAGVEARVQQGLSEAKTQQEAEAAHEAKALELVGEGGFDGIKAWAETPGNLTASQIRLINNGLASPDKNVYLATLEELTRLRAGGSEKPKGKTKPEPKLDTLLAGSKGVQPADKNPGQTDKPAITSMSEAARLIDRHRHDASALAEIKDRAIKGGLGHLPFING